MRTTDQALGLALKALQRIALTPEFDPGDPEALEDLRELAADTIEGIGPLEKLLGVKDVYAPTKKRAVARRTKLSRKGD